MAFLDWFLPDDFDSSSTGNQVTPGGAATTSPGLLDWTARNLFVDDADEQMYDDLAAADAVKIKQQVADGKITKEQGNYNLALADQIGTPTYDSNLGTKGVGGFFTALPWWVWALIVAGAIALFVYFGGLGWLKRRMNK